RARRREAPAPAGRGNLSMRARSAATVWAAVLALAAAAPAAAQAPVARAQPVVEVQQRLLAEADADGAPLEITVANAGKAAADEVTVTDALPPGGVLVSASPMPVRQRNQLVWPIGRMEPGERRVLRLKVSVPTGPELRNN